MNPCEFIELDMRGLANFIMLAGANVVLVDGARGCGKDDVLQDLANLLPQSVTYEAAAYHGDVHPETGAILRPHHGLDVGQARLAALDFLEQVPVDQVVLFDRSPMSSMVFEPDDDASRGEMEGWLRRVHEGQLRQVLVVAFSDDGARAAEQDRYAILLEAMLERGAGSRLHVFETRTEVVDRCLRTRVRARHLTTAWNYR